MAELSPAGIDIAILVAAALLYGFIWFASRNLSRLGKILARLAPLGLVIPAMIYLSSLPMGRRPAEFTSREASAPPPRSEEQRSLRRAEEARPRAVEAEPPRPSAAPSPPPSPPPPAAQPMPPPPTTAPPERSARPEPPGGASGGSAPPASEPPVGMDGARPPASSPSAPPAGAPAAPQSDWQAVPVFYGTDRVHKDEPKRITYTSDRASRLELGRALVTVPRTHQVPNIERPFAIRIPYINVTIYEQAEDPQLHFTIQELKALTREEFIARVREQIARSSAFKDQAVVFVHGYNTPFDFALFRTAQMAYDLKFDGAAFLYSWPSGGGVISYNYDRESSEQAEPYLREFIELVVKESGAKSVSLIAHSMGNMPLLRVLQALGPGLPPGVTLNQIILAAPDVDRNLFENLAANVKAWGRGVTLYCSNNDLAMAAARRVAGGIPRAGDVPADGPIVLAGIDTIDVSETSTDYLTLNHSTYAEKSALLNDIGLLLQTGERPPDRRIPILLKVNTPKGDFWRYPLIPR